jgi:aerotaxis receptor
MSKEKMIKPKTFIVSETDSEGNIVDCNLEFLMVTGYTREEIIGQPHNIIRHPDMPKAAFQGLWETLKSGKTWRGIVKNLTKSGDYYWVYATVSPVNRLDGDAVYTSIRQAVTRAEAEKYEAIYKKMCEEENK